MKDDTSYGTKLASLFSTTKVPLTITDAAEKVGCSKQRAYAWLDRNRTHLVAIGKRYHGGTTYIDRNNPNRPASSIAEDKLGGTLGIGAALTVVSVGVQGSQVVFDLMTGTGQVIRVTPVTEG